jgi:4-hydroxy-tetrahydrodipicolinate synthase
MGNRPLVAAVPTVFHDDGALDRDGSTALAATYAAAGCTMLIALEATAGEPDTLEPEDRDAVVRAIRDGASGLPVFVGVGVVDASAVARAHRAGAAGADGLIVTVVSDQQRTGELLSEVAGTGLPLWLHRPSGGAGPSGTSLLALAADLVVDALLTEAAPTPDSVAELVGAGQRVFGGLAGLFLPEELEAGATGTMVASAVPERLQEVLANAPDEGPVPLDAFLAVLPYLRLEAGSPGLRISKEAWRQRGVVGSGRTRRGQPLAATTKRAITRRLRDVGVAPRDGYPGA